MSELVGVFPPSLNHDPVRRALDCLQEGFQIIGYDWHYVYVNPAAARHGRRPAEELVGHSIFEEYPGIDQTPMFARLRHSMEARVPQVFESEFAFPDGSKRWFELRVQPSPEGILRVLVRHRPAEAPAAGITERSSTPSRAHVAHASQATATALERSLSPFQAASSFESAGTNVGTNRSGTRRSITPSRDLTSSARPSSSILAN